MANKIILEKIKENNLYIFSWLVFILSVVTLYSNLDESQLNVFINSDTLGIANLYKDLILNKGLLKDWYWAPAPSFFPDVAMYFIVASVFKASIIKTIFLCAIFQLVLLVYLFTFIFKKIAGPDLKKYKWLIPLFLAMYFLEVSYFSQDVLFPLLMVTLGFHIGAFINALILIVIYLKVSSNLLKNISICLFAIIGSFNDRLFIAMLLLPLVFTLLFSIKKSNWRQSFISIVCLTIGCFMGLHLFDMVVEKKLISFISPHKIYDFNNMMPSVKRFFSQILDYISYLGFKSLQILFTFASIIFCIIYFIKKRKSGETTKLFLVLFYAFFCICTFAAPLLNGNYSGSDTLRYNVYPFFMASIIFSWLTGYFLKTRLQTSKIKIVSYSAIIVLVLLIGFKLRVKGFNDFLNYYPAEVREVDSVAAKYNLKNGVASYWAARKITMLSKNKLEIFSVFDGCNIHELGTNITWYYNREFDFVIASNLDSAAITKNFKIKETIKAEKHNILSVDKFIFPTGKYFPITK